MKSDCFVIISPSGALDRQTDEQNETDGQRDKVGPVFSSSSIMSWEKIRQIWSRFEFSLRDSRDIFLLMLKEHFV